MLRFFKDAFGELHHIVWPTRKESVRYMQYTVGAIVIVGIFLSIIGVIFSESLSAIRSQFPHETPNFGNEMATQEDLQKIQEGIKNGTIDPITLGQTTIDTTTEAPVNSENATSATEGTDETDVNPSETPTE